MAFFNSIIAYYASFQLGAIAAVALLGFLGLDIVLGIAAAVKSGTFDAQKLANFVGGDLFGVAIALAFGLGAKDNGIFASVFGTASAAMLATLAAKINANFQTVFGINPHIAPPVLPQDPPTTAE